MCITCQSSPLICRNLHQNPHSPWVCLPQSKLEHYTMVLEVMRVESRLLLQGWGSTQKKGSWIHPFLRQQWKPGNVYNTQLWTGLTPVGRAPHAWSYLFSGSCGSSSTKPLTLYLLMMYILNHGQTIYYHFHDRLQLSRSASDPLHHPLNCNHHHHHCSNDADDDDIYIMVECVYVTKKWPPVRSLMMTIYI